MEISSLASLDSLAEIGLRGGVDMRPTLLRVLTDLYMQKMRHTPEEVHHYTELALRLLEVVDAQTRAAVAARLSRHLSPPLRVIQSLVNDLPEIAAPLRSHPMLQPANPAGVTTPRPSAVSDTDSFLAAEQEMDQAFRPSASRIIEPTTAKELTDLFFAATAVERSLILRSLDVVAPLPAGSVAVSRNAAVGRRLEGAALGRNREDFAQQLARSLHIPREQARRIARDNLGEPMVVAAKALEIPRDLFYRILIFVNPAVGHSVERVHALAELYDDMTVQAAEGMVAIWQALHMEERVSANHRPQAWNDEARARARPAAPMRRTPAAAQTKERRDAS